MGLVARHLVTTTITSHCVFYCITCIFFITMEPYYVYYCILIFLFIILVLSYIASAYSENLYNYIIECASERNI